MQVFRIVVIGAVTLVALVVLTGVALASNQAGWTDFSVQPLSTVQVIALTVAGFVPLLFMLLRERRRPNSPFEE